MATAKFMLPYEPQYTGHRDAEKRRKEARDRLRRVTREQVSPSIVPETLVRESAHDDEAVADGEKIK